MRHRESTAATRKYCDIVKVLRHRKNTAATRKYCDMAKTGLPLIETGVLGPFIKLSRSFEKSIGGGSSSLSVIWNGWMELQE
ncbi:unnamed protein product [Caenorhabditis auriculariae]|uniref:Uncharacterized protein n=1 Tax=Caenorhabditis auriculariae TaxID=2777116 RepID=A0A8S1HP98_9PELO|nr:unnamed protein product [Caenorhabditis auriculariae]